MDEITTRLDRIEQLLADQQKMAYTADELARRLSVQDPRKIAQWRQRGLLKGIRTGKGWIYPKQQVEIFLQKYAGQELTTPEAQAAAAVNAERRGL